MSNQFKLISGGFDGHHLISNPPEQTDFLMHAHDKPEIYYFISGNVAYYVEGNEYTLHKGDIMIMRPSEAHNPHIRGSEPYERVSIHFPVSIIKDFDSSGELMRPFYERKLGTLNKYSLEEFDNNLCAQCFEGISEGKLPLELDVKAKLLAILTEIYKAYIAKLEKGDAATQNNDISVRLINYINRHLFEELSLESIGARFYLSPSQINRIFNRATGSSIWKYITVKRLLSAREKILSGEGAIKASSECGFKEYSSFYRLYRKYFGVSPKRENSQEQKIIIK